MMHVSFLTYHLFNQKSIITMTPRQIQLVKNSWAIVSTLDIITVGSLFYNRLFEIDPETKPMFSVTVEEQARKAMSMLNYIIQKLDKLDDIVDEVTKLAQAHAKYGVGPEHYLTGGVALLWTLEKGLGKHWNEEVREAWVSCYTVLSNAMIES